MDFLSYVCNIAFIYYNFVTSVNFIIAANSFFMKYLIIIALTTICLMANQAFALEVPFINNIKANIKFEDSTDENLLRPLLLNLLKNKREGLKGADTTINKKARIEKEAIGKMLRSEGFYSAKVSYLIEGDDIKYSVNPGKSYLLDKIAIKSNLETNPQLKELGLKTGQRFRADDVLSAISELKKYMEKNYCLWEINVDYDATVNHKDKLADIVLIIGDSQEINFGSISFDGLTTIDEQYLKNKLGLEEGGCFKHSKIDKARLNLFQTGLISGVETAIKQNNGSADVIFEVTERKHKTIKAGGGISSDEGVSVSAGWEHRNFFGKAQKLQVNSKLSELYRKAEINLTIPSFLDRKQSLTLKGQISQENLEAFDADSAVASATLKRELAKYLTGSVGSQLKITSVEDNEKNETFGLVSFPFSLNYDRRDNILDPKHGWLLSGEVTPFVDVLDTSTGFLKSSIGGSAYYTSQRIILKPTIALRGAIGSINGLNTDDIPADERFYAGGGGSVRGYPFQKLGPLDIDNPTGGRSFSEVSLETRAQFSQDWGGVLFFDGGNAYDDITPDFQEGVRWAYGGGVRYYTDFAPLRFDVAIPLERRRGIDDAFQFYISIGQAF